MGHNNVHWLVINPFLGLWRTMQVGFVVDAWQCVFFRHNYSKLRRYYDSNFYPSFSLQYTLSEGARAFFLDAFTQFALFSKPLRASRCCAIFGPITSYSAIAKVICHQLGLIKGPPPPDGLSSPPTIDSGQTNLPVLANTLCTTG